MPVLELEGFCFLDRHVQADCQVVGEVIAADRNHRSVGHGPFKENNQLGGGGANIDESLGTDPTFVGPFRPDTVWNYELGTKGLYFDNTTSINASSNERNASNRSTKPDRPWANGQSGLCSGVSGQCGH